MKFTVKRKFSRYRPGMAQRVGRGIVLLFHHRGTRRGEWSAARPGRILPPRKTRYPFTGGWVGPRAGLDGRKISPHWNSIPDRPARNQSVYRLSYPARSVQYTLLLLYLMLVMSYCVSGSLSPRDGASSGCG